MSTQTTVVSYPYEMLTVSSTVTLTVHLTTTSYSSTITRSANSSYIAGRLDYAFRQQLAAAVCCTVFAVVLVVFNIAGFVLLAKQRRNRPNNGPIQFDQMNGHSLDSSSVCDSEPLPVYSAPPPPYNTRDR